MAADQIEFKISEALIKPIIEAKINTAIVEAMGGHERMIAEMVAGFLNQRVDSDGTDNGYSSNKPRVTWLLQNMLTESMQKALTNYLATKGDLMEREFEKFLNSKKGSSQVISAMQEGLCKALTDKWRTTITFSPLER